MDRCQTNDTSAWPKNGSTVSRRHFVTWQPAVTPAETKRYRCVEEYLCEIGGFCIHGRGANGMVGEPAGASRTMCNCASGSNAEQEGVWLS